MPKQRLRQQHAHFLSALQLAHLALVQLVRNVQTLQQNCSVGLGRVAVFLADNAFQFAQSHPVFIGELGLLVEVSRSCRAAHSRLLPMMTVSITRNASNANWSWLSTPNFLRADDGALLRFQLSGQQLHESGLAGPVGTGKSIALPGSKRGGHIFEQTFLRRSA